MAKYGQRTKQVRCSLCMSVKKWRSVSFNVHTEYIRVCPTPDSTDMFIFINYGGALALWMAMSVIHSTTLVQTGISQELLDRSALRFVHLYIYIPHGMNPT